MNNFYQKAFTATLKEYGVGAPEFEHRFHPTRRWRFDAAWPSIRVAVEMEGGIYGTKGRKCTCCGQPQNKGGHSSVSGILKDMEKYNAANELGWCLLRYTPQDLCKQASILQIKRTIQRVAETRNDR